MPEDLLTGSTRPNSFLGRLLVALDRRLRDRRRVFESTLDARCILRIQIGLLGVHVPKNARTTPSHPNDG